MHVRVLLGPCRYRREWPGSPKVHTRTTDDGHLLGIVGEEEKRKERVIRGAEASFGGRESSSFDGGRPEEGRKKCPEGRGDGALLVGGLKLGLAEGECRWDVAAAAADQRVIAMCLVSCCLIMCALPGRGTHADCVNREERGGGLSDATISVCAFSLLPRSREIS